MAGTALTFTGKFIDKMSRGLQKATKNTTKLGKETDKAGKTAKRAGKQSEQLGGGLSKASVAAGAAGVAIGAAAVALKLFVDNINEAVKSAAEFETGMARIGTLLGEQAAELMPALAHSVDDLSVAYGKAAGDVQGAMFQAISAGVDATEATEFMGVAAQAAVGGFTSMETAVDGLTSVVNAYGLDSSAALDIANSTFAANKYGKTTFDEIASSIGKVAPIAASLGVSFDELAATIVATTKAGISTKETVTGIRGALTNVIKPTDDARRLSRDLGIEFNTQAIKSKGWLQFLTDIMEATGGNTEALSTLFPNIRGLSTLMAAASETGLKDMKIALQDMATDATTVADAYTLVAATHGQRMKEIDQKAEESSRRLGAAYQSEIEAGKRWSQSLGETVDDVGVAFDRLSFNVGGWGNLFHSVITRSFGPAMLWNKNTRTMSKVVDELGEKTREFVEDNHHQVEGLIDAIAAGGDWEAQVDKIRAAYAASIGMTVKQAFATGEAAMTLTEEAAAFDTSTEACMEHIGWMAQSTDGTWEYTEAALEAAISSNAEAQAFQDAALACGDLSVVTEDLTEKERRYKEASERAKAQLEKYRKEQDKATGAATRNARASAERARATKAAADADRLARAEIEALTKSLATANIVMVGLDAANKDFAASVAEMMQPFDWAEKHKEKFGGLLEEIQRGGPLVSGLAEEAKGMIEAFAPGNEKEQLQALIDKSAKVAEAIDKVTEATRRAAAADAKADAAHSKFTKTVERSSAAFKEAGDMIAEGLAAGVGSAISAFIKGEQNFGEAMASMTRDVFLNVGQQALIKSLMQAAEGYAKLSNPVTAPLAKINFKASAQYAAVAAMGFAGGAAVQAGIGGGFGGGREEEGTEAAPGVAESARQTGRQVLPSQAAQQPIIINANFSGQPIVDKAQIGKAIDDALHAAEREGMARRRGRY